MRALKPILAFLSFVCVMTTGTCPEVFAKAAAAEIPQSSRLGQFEIKRCSLDRCFRATADLGYVSVSGNAISAADAHLEIIEASKLTQIHHCADFHYDLQAQFLICNNSEKEDAASLRINSAIEVKTF